MSDTSGAAGSLRFLHDRPVLPSPVVGQPPLPTATGVFNMASAKSGRTYRHRSGLIVAAVVLTSVLVLVLILSHWTGRGGNAAAGCEGASCPDRPASGAPATPEEPSPTAAAPRSPAVGQGDGRRPSRSPSHSPSPSGQAEQTRPCSSPATCAFPHAGNTGPTLRSYTRRDGDLSIRDHGAVISGLDLHGSLDIYANDVTVTNCRITSSNWWAVNLRPGYTNLKVTRCRISDVPGQGPDNGGSNYAISNMGNGAIEVGWNNISGFGNVLSMGHGNIHDNYIHDLSTFITDDGEWQHTDAVISGGGDDHGLDIRHNTLLNQTPVEQGATAAIGLFADNGIVSNTVVDRNWLAGGSYVLYGGGPGARDIRVTNNVFSTQYHPSGGRNGFVAAWNHDGPGNVWSGNVTSEGRPVVP